MSSPERITIVGAGPAGTLTAILLARRGFTVSLYDRHPDPRLQTLEGGRSINLALAARGIHALERADLMDEFRSLLIPLRGRRVHDLDGSTQLLPYGQNDREVIHSFSRGEFNRRLVVAAAREPRIGFHFGQRCLGLSADLSTLRFRDGASGRDYEVSAHVTIAADGAGSAVRASLEAAGLLQSREEMLDHDYREITIPAQSGRHAIDPGALHIWPRGGFMLIALPNTDGSFTATLFLARQGDPSFAQLRDAPAITGFFARWFPDAAPLIPALLEEFRDHPQGRLGTVYTDRWQHDGRVLLLGDAAHAIVPFHGQGMNAALEDCVALDDLLSTAPRRTNAGWKTLFADFERERRPNCDAIARMALENYVEMRDTVRDPKFARQKVLSLELERRFPTRFVPRYSMVMFHAEIPYSDAERRGAVQARILDELDAKTQANGGEVDYALAERLVHAQLPALPTVVRSARA